MLCLIEMVALLLLGICRKIHNHHRHAHVEGGTECLASLDDNEIQHSDV